MANKLLAWILPEDEQLAGWVVNNMTGLGRLEEWVQEVEYKRTPLAEVFKRNNPLVNFESLVREDSSRTKMILYETTKNYNEGIDELSEKYPITLSFIWEMYRETSGIARGLNDFGLLEKEGDRNFGFHYALTMMDQTRAAKQLVPSFKTFDIKNQIQLIDYEPEFLLGIGRYTFQDSKGKVRTSLWDLREKDIPKFSYIC